MATLTIPFPDFQNAAPIVAAQHNSNNSFIVNFVNGLSAGSNFDSGAIGTASIANQAITTALIADANVTSAKIQNSVVLTSPTLVGANATAIYVTNNVVFHVTTTPSATNYTLALTDDGKVVEMSGGGTLTVPTYASVAFPNGTQITILQTGGSQVTVAGAGGVTVNGTPGLKLRTQWSSATLLKRADDLWVLMGDLSA